MLVSKLNIRAICKTMCEAWTICSSTRGVGVPSRVGVGPAGVGGGVTPQAQVVGRLTWWRWVLNGFKTLKSGQYPDYQALPAILIDQGWLWQKKPRDARILNFSNGLWALEIGSGANVEILCGWFRAWGSNITFLKITKMTSLFHNQWLNKRDIPTWIL